MTFNSGGKNGLFVVEVFTIVLIEDFNINKEPLATTMKSSGDARVMHF